MREPNLIDAVHTLFTLQRWNFLPRAETWVEAENVALAAHLGFVVANKVGLTKEEIRHVLARLLLAPLMKHFLSDVSYRVRSSLNELSKDKKWEDVRGAQKTKVVNLFPNIVARDVVRYLDKKYTENETARERVEAILDCLQVLIAEYECLRNSKVYPDYYQRYLDALNRKRERLEKNKIARDFFIAAKTFIPAGMEEEESSEAAQEEQQKRWFQDYISVVRCLKEIRRWNRINRTVESSVLSHTFLVALLTLVFSWMEKDAIKAESEDKNSGDFGYEAVRLALFHDLPEALTGDIITPIKAAIKEAIGATFSDVEKKLIEEDLLPLLADAPNVQEEIKAMRLHTDLDDREPHSVRSMVKGCDRLALVIECLFERRASRRLEGEMASTYINYLETLQNSEWRSIREFCSRLSVRYPVEI